MTMIYFVPKQSQNGVLCLFTSKFQTSTIGYYTGPTADDWEGEARRLGRRKNLIGRGVLDDTL